MDPEDFDTMVAFARSVALGCDKTRLPIEVKLRGLAMALLYVVEKDERQSDASDK